MLSYCEDNPISNCKLKYSFRIKPQVKLHKENSEASCIVLKVILYFELTFILIKLANLLVGMEILVEFCEAYSWNASRHPKRWGGPRSIPRGV